MFGRPIQSEHGVFVFSTLTKFSTSNAFCIPTTQSALLFICACEMYEAIGAARMKMPGTIRRLVGAASSMFGDLLLDWASCMRKKRELKAVVCDEKLKKTSDFLYY